MKKAIALWMSVLILVGMLAACGSEPQTPAVSQTPGEQEPAMNQDPVEQNPAGADVPEETTAGSAQSNVTGELLDAPEVSFDTSLEQLYIYFTMPGEGDEVTSMEIALDQVTEDMYVLYVTNGLLKLNEMVYEVSDDGITKYYKDTFMESFLLETELSQAELENEKNTMMELLSCFMMMGSDLEGVQYEKTDEVAVALTGDALTYNMVQNGQVTGKITIDKATGLMVSMKDAEGNSLYTVMDIKTSDLGIPAYK